ncbi:MAG: DUF1152 domain-containing protein [Desulfurococcaceae archaeon]|nr:DUF1152 domain-containing protein [Sulfolobales archaeon]MDW8170699.1 DUF1152 domain-containing protein [Desulfurococcaceae archaeon]
MDSGGVLEDLFSFKPRSLIVYGAGGGGDAVSAAVLAKWIEEVCGVKTYVGGVPWERYTVDPEPGPVPFNCFTNSRSIGDHSIGIGPSTKVFRAGREFTPQLAKVSSVIRRELYAADLWRGAVGYSKGLSELAEALGVEAFIAIDVGGDIVAEGSESNLWSPLADSMSLAAFSKLKNSILVVVSPGADGELSQEEVLERIEVVARNNGLLWIKGVSRSEAELYEELLKQVITEASRVPLMAYRGRFGEVLIREGSRRVKVGVMQMLSFFMDISVVYSLSRTAKAVEGSRTLTEANEALHRIGVYTEYDLEKRLKHQDL